MQRLEFDQTYQVGKAAGKYNWEPEEKSINRNWHRNDRDDQIRPAKRYYKSVPYIKETDNNKYDGEKWEISQYLKNASREKKYSIRNEKYWVEWTTE